MCGISGIFSPQASESPSFELLQRMTAVLAHRGPDDNGFYRQGPVGLGHRRLSIIDVAGGKQPIVSADGMKAIVFNGEIYNFKALRRTLTEQGYRFVTQSDTEVILAAYSAYGTRCVEQLRGMFAFAIWDGTTQRLFLARDRVGIKPLYYCWDGNTFLFASELKAILQDRRVQRDIDPCAVDDYLTYLYIPAPKTIFRRIRKLRPGHTLTVSAEGLAEREYWDLTFEPKERVGEAEYAAGLREKLHEAVAIRLMSEVPLGAFLSGGLDSSAVVGLMTKLLDQPVNTASIGFREAGFDELPYARDVARAFHTAAHERTVEADAAKILDTLLWHYDEPFADASMVPTYYVSEVARERVTVCLTGDGGDENFAGYRRYRFDLFENRLRRWFPAALRRPVFGTLGWMYPKADWLPQIFRAKTLLTNLSLPPEQAYYHSMCRFTPVMKHVLYHDAFKRDLGGYDSFSVMHDYFNRCRDWDPLSRVQYVDIKTYLVDDILTKVDRASMAHSLEVRVPLLDHEVMEYAAQIPSDYKLRRGEGKYIFKRAMTDFIPAAVLHRPKMGFALPLAQWFRRELRTTFEDHVFGPNAFLTTLCDIMPIRQWWGQHQRGTRDYAYHLWALLVLECWGKKFLDSPS
jgi:asparagine synthase (glutamine-hydrolysing)